MTPYFQEDGITIYFGDALDLFPKLFADILVTDPPYGLAYVSHWATQRQVMANDEDTSARDAIVAMWGLDRPAAIFGTWKCPRPNGIRNVLIWDKSGGNGPGMGDLSLAFGNSHEEIYLLGEWPKRGARRASVIRSNTAIARLAVKTGHPTPKPVGLMASILDAAPEGTVIDPFAGSGATLLAARQLGRQAIGIEIEEKYCEIMANRMAQGVLLAEVRRPSAPSESSPAVLFGA